MISDAETNDFVTTVSEGKRAWLGAHRVGPTVEPKPRNDQWTLIDGSPLEYSTWYPGGPDNWWGGDEFCLEMNAIDSSGNWNDVPCDNNIIYDGHDHFICQL